MKTVETTHFTLSNFEGPIDFLLHLIQKNEIDIYDVSLHKIMEQFVRKWEEYAAYDLDQGAEFVGHASFLLWLKSKTLLPLHEQEITPEELEIDPRFEVIHQLVEYCRFKQAAKDLASLEQQQASFFLRGNETPGLKKPLGVEHLSIEDLAGLFKHILSKAVVAKGSIHEEVYRVSDKIQAIQALLHLQDEIPFDTLFAMDRVREELIVTFLAILELMKMGQILAMQNSKSLYFKRRTP